MADLRRYALAGEDQHEATTFPGCRRGVAASWSGTVFAQHSDRLRRIGMLHDYPEGELEGCSQIT